MLATGTRDTAVRTATATQPPVPTGPPVYGVDTRRKLLALTFDDGPGPQTPQVLRVLRERNVDATFFVLGNRVAGQERLLRRMQRDGHTIGNHSWDHSDELGGGGTEAARQLRRTSTAIEEATGSRPDTFRPPYGLRSTRLDGNAARLGMRTIMWSVDTRDWSTPGARTIADTAVRNARAGSVILMHDAGGPRTQTIQALPLVIDRLRAKGYRFVTVPQLIAAQRSQ